MSDDESANIDNGELTSKLTCSALRKNGYVIIKGRPCKIVDMSSSKTGKHGHTKVHLVCIDIFTSKKLEDVVPTTHEVDVPNTHRDEYKLEGVDSGHLLLTDQDGNVKNDVTVPDGDIGSQIMDRLSRGDKSIVTILGAMNEQACISFKDA